MLAQIKELFFTAPQHQPDKRQIDTAAAALLIEVMVIDGKANPEEERLIRSVLGQQLGTDQNTLDALFKEAKQEAANATSLFQFTRLVNDHYDHAQKFNLLTTLWKVAFADNHLSKHEEHSIRRIADLLHMRHSEFIQAKQQARG